MIWAKVSDERDKSNLITQQRTVALLRNKSDFFRAEMIILSRSSNNDNPFRLLDIVPISKWQANTGLVNHVGKQNLWLNLSRYCRQMTTFVWTLNDCKNLLFTDAFGPLLIDLALDQTRSIVSGGSGVFAVGGVVGSESKIDGDP